MICANLLKLMLRDEIIINSTRVQKSGLFFKEFTFLLNFLHYDQVRETPPAGLLSKEYVSFNNGACSITEAGRAKLLNTLDLSRDLYYNDQKMTALAESLQNLFPEGVKQDTGIYWRGNKELIKNKLMRFIEKYGISDELLIIRAAQQYVMDHDDLTYMRTLPYFIEKDGNSDLLTVVENLN